MPLTKDYPALGASLKPQPRQMVSFADGDTISIRSVCFPAIRPRRKALLGEPKRSSLDRCAERLRGDFYAAMPTPMREYLLERLDGEAALRHLRAGHGASARFEILLALTLPDGAKRPVAVMAGGESIDTYGRLLAYCAPYLQQHSC